MPRHVAALLYESRRLLDVGSQGDFGELLGSSRRSGQRWERGEATPTSEQLHKLAALVHPKNDKLAAEISETTGITLEKLGLVRPPPASLAAPPPLPPPPPPPPDPIHIVDTVVCAAAEAMQLMPDAVRPALRAAFRRARLAGLTVDAVDGALSGRSALSPADAEGVAKKSDKAAGKKAK